MEEFLKDLDGKIKPLLEILKQELSGIRTNRPNPQLVEDLEVDYLGQKLKVKQLGSISVAPPRELQISVWDRNSAAPVAKALDASPQKFNPSVQGSVIRIQMPPLTAERREELMKVVRSAAEKERIRLRALRDEEKKKLEGVFKAKTVSEDQKFKTKKQIQERVDKTNQEIESLL